MRQRLSSRLDATQSLTVLVARLRGLETRLTRYRGRELELERLVSERATQKRRRALARATRQRRGLEHSIALVVGDWLKTRAALRDYARAYNRGTLERAGYRALQAELAPRHPDKAHLDNLAAEVERALDDLDKQADQRALDPILAVCLARTGIGLTIARPRETLAVGGTPPGKGKGTRPGGSRIHRKRVGGGGLGSSANSPRAGETGAKNHQFSEGPKG